MIIFDLDGTLADCEHRRHFVDPKKNAGYKRRWGCTKDEFENNKLIPEEYIKIETTPLECHDSIYQKFNPDFKSFYEACDKDTIIEPTWTVIRNMFGWDYYEDVHIWSGRCESVRKKTENWLEKHYIPYRHLKMRPIGDSTPDEVLKQKWLDEALAEGKKIEFVFDDRKKVCDMWVRRGIFVFDVSQGKGDF